ncbi:class I SAM-dependent methyltransferase [Paucibacter sp. APW11]|uniref:Class I SAM-dependent methyltransferase n=1 Tax=Roseateles aquae TaxID=3077235 RepID=A0ABU3P9X4_9BURK|nr:class I SAM-dependent methyltransferase [Paucibacter sp. APW11]MDT8999335.1 class I SAM-dependent methyltransferase [Paucibacter sp. APW11]
MASLSLSPRWLHACWRWPTPALFGWLSSWAVYRLGLQAGMPPAPALLLALLPALLLGLKEPSRWRRLLIACGFPLALLLTQQAQAWPAWAWLLPALLLLLLYPRRSWGDAPLFPTPRGALRELVGLLNLPAGARVLDAGCGLGDGLRELRRVFPEARIEGIEWSGLLARLTAWRCPWAAVHRGDMWALDWQPYQLLYVFQRPESMAAVLRKSCAEMHAEAWLVSLDFEIPAAVPHACFRLGPLHSVWVYRIGALRGRADGMQRID